MKIIVFILIFHNKLYSQNINKLHITAIQNNEITKLQPIVNTNSSDFTETDPIFQASEASLFVTGDKANLDNQSGVNSGDETTASIRTKLGTASSLTPGYLTTADWNTFNNKQNTDSTLTAFSTMGNFTN